MASNLERHIDCPNSNNGTPTVPQPSTPRFPASDPDTEFQRLFDDVRPPLADADSLPTLDTPLTPTLGPSLVPPLDDTSTTFPDVHLPSPPSKLSRSLDLQNAIHNCNKHNGSRIHRSLNGSESNHSLFGLA